MWSRTKREIKHRRKDVGAVKDHIRTRCAERGVLSGEKKERRARSEGDGLLEANGWQGVVDAGVVSPCPRRFAAPYGAAIHPGQLVLLSAKDSVKAYMRGVDLGCDPASWFSVADASMGPRSAA